MSDSIPSSTPPGKSSVRTSSSTARRKRQKQSSAENTPKSTTVYYKSLGYPRLLIARGVQQSFQKPTEYRTMIAQLEDRPANWQDLPSRTLNSFNVILQIDGNEGSIQKGIVPILMNYAGLMLNAETLVIMDIPFSKQCQLPVHAPLHESLKNISAPYPNVSVGLRRSQFTDCKQAIFKICQFSLNSVQIQFRFSSDSVQIQFRF
ncbi:hypothetical protein ACN38_g9219, partial [Penicillium nordicum]